MTPWNHALRVSFVCSKAWVVLPLLLFCRYCCNSDGRFATLFEICGYDCCDSSIEICLARQRIYLVLRIGCWGWARNPGSWLFWTADTWPVTFDVGKMRLAVTEPSHICIPHVGTTTRDRTRDTSTAPCPTCRTCPTRTSSTRSPFVHPAITTVASVFL